MGGGLTRSPAMLFSLLSLYFYLAMIETQQRRARDIILVAVSLSLTFLSHLEIGWFTVYSLALLWFFRGRNRRNFVSSVFIMLGVLVLTSPYWVQVIRYHQIQPFLAGLASGGSTPFLSIFELFYFNFTEELIFPILATIALIGVVISIVKRDYLSACLAGDECHPRCSQREPQRCDPRSDAHLGGHRGRVYLLDLEIQTVAEGPCNPRRKTARGFSPGRGRWSSICSAHR